MAQYRDSSKVPSMDGPCSAAAGRTEKENPISFGDTSERFDSTLESSLHRDVRKNSPPEVDAGSAPPAVFFYLRHPHDVFALPASSETTGSINYYRKAADICFRSSLSFVCRRLFSAPPSLLLAPVLRTIVHVLADTLPGTHTPPPGGGFTHTHTHTQ
jgi:hypothetical protein